MNEQRRTFLRGLLLLPAALPGLAAAATYARVESGWWGYSMWCRLGQFLGIYQAGVPPMASPGLAGPGLATYGNCSLGVSFPADWVAGGPAGRAVKDYAVKEYGPGGLDTVTYYAHA